MRDRAAVAAARALPGASRHAAEAIQTELDWSDLRPRRELNFPEWLAEGVRRARALDEALERIVTNPTAAARAEVSRRRAAWSEHTEGRLELMDAFAREEGS